MNLTVKQLDKAIKIMKRAKGKIDMDWFQHGDSNLCTTEKELHACGNTACFAGYVALSKEFHADGGSIYMDGKSPEFKGLNQELAIAEWLHISHEEATDLVYGDTIHPGVFNETTGEAEYHSKYYNKNFHKVTEKDVISKLQELKLKYSGV